MPTPQFGQPGLEGPYPDRPAAFAVIERDGLLALVRVEREHRGLVLDLPGGGIDPGETAPEAAVRECGEEAGLVVALDAEPFVYADHFFLHGDGEVRNTRGAFFAGRMQAEDPALKIEDDHDRGPRPRPGARADSEVEAIGLLSGAAEEGGLLCRRRARG